MAKSIVTDNLRFNILKAFEQRIKSNENSLYMYYSRPLKWSKTTNENELADLEETPSDAERTQEEENSVKSALLAMKKLNDRDITVGFRSIIWTSNQVYVEYSDRTNLTDQNFYVITSENNVYKCIDNNGNSSSTIEPTGTDPLELIATDDGYLWKYMFTIENALLRKFNVQGYYPISSNEQVKQAAVPGAIDKIVIDDRGSGYTPNAQIPIYVFGDGDQNSTATIDIENTSETGEIRTVAITSGGSGYDQVLNAESVRPTPVLIRQTASQIQGASNSTPETQLAFGWAEVNQSGEIVNIDVVIQGSGYQEGGATVTQSSCVAYAQTNSLGEIDRVIIEYRGRNFTLGTGFIINEQGSGCVLVPIIPPTGGHGSNPEKELYSNALLFNARFAYDEEGGDFTTENDFRTVGIIENPRSTLTGEIATSRTLSNKEVINITGTNANDFQNDEVLIGRSSGARATIIDSPDSTTLRVIRDDVQSNTLPFQDNETIEGSELGNTAIISSKNPAEYVPYSGEILFVNNRLPITRSPNQIETVNFILEF